VKSFCQERGGYPRLDVRLEGDTVWLSLARMATLFGRRVLHFETLAESLENSADGQLLQRMQQLADGKTYQVEAVVLDEAYRRSRSGG
jgi:hypothetical protein